MARRKANGSTHGTPTPHDMAFKQFLNHPETARDFMQLHLPAELQAICDFSTLKLESGSFVEENLRACFSDVLYSLNERAEKLYGRSFPLVDVTVIPDDEIMGHRSMAALTLLQKHIHRRDLADLMDNLATLLLTEHMTGQQLVSLINYLVQAGKTSDAEAFVRELAQRVPQHEDQLMTIAQQLEQKGIEKGLEQGLMLGEQRGIEKGKFEVARTMLQNGLDRDTIIKLTGLTADELAKIRH